MNHVPAGWEYCGMPNRLPVYMHSRNPIAVPIDPHKPVTFGLNTNDTPREKKHLTTSDEMFPQSGSVWNLMEKYDKGTQRYTTVNRLHQRQEELREEAENVVNNHMSGFMEDLVKNGISIIDQNVRLNSKDYAIVKQVLLDTAAMASNITTDYVLLCEDLGIDKEYGYIATIDSAVVETRRFICAEIEEMWADINT